MTFPRLVMAVVACICFVYSIGATPVYAKEVALGWNVQNAGPFMFAANGIEKNAEGLDKVPKILKPYKLTYFRQWKNRFKEDLAFLFAVDDSHVFIAFRGTSNDANRAMNDDGRPNLELGTRVHTGWWRAANKAWNEELSNLVKDKLGNRKILVTGHSMGGAVGAYVVKLMQHDRGGGKTLKGQTDIRLVTFGAPRYTFNKHFFDRENTLIFTVETAMANQCVDKVVWDWQVNLRKTHALYRKADVQKPDRDEGVQYSRCMTNRTKQKDEKGVNDKNSVHSGSIYLEVAKSNKCNYVGYKACSPYKDYVD